MIGREVAGRYEVYPAARSLASLKGSVKKLAKPVSIEDMNRAIAAQGACVHQRHLHIDGSHVGRRSSSRGRRQHDRLPRRKTCDSCVAEPARVP
jgi:hypothetical protein